MKYVPPDGSSAKIDCYAERIHYLSLESKTPGLYTRLTEETPEFWRQRGVKTVSASAANEQADEILRKRGDWQDRNNRLEWDL